MRLSPKRMSNGVQANDRSSRFSRFSSRFSSRPCLGNSFHRSSPLGQQMLFELIRGFQTSGSYSLAVSSSVLPSSSSSSLACRPECVVGLLAFAAFNARGSMCLGWRKEAESTLPCIEMCSLVIFCHSLGEGGKKSFGDGDLPLVRAKD